MIDKKILINFIKTLSFNELISLIKNEKYFTYKNKIYKNDIIKYLNKFDSIYLINIMDHGIRVKLNKYINRGVIC